MGLSLSQSMLTIRMKWNNEYEGALENYRMLLSYRRTSYLKDNAFNENFNFILFSALRTIYKTQKNCT